MTGISFLTMGQLMRKSIIAVQAQRMAAGKLRQSHLQKTRQFMLD